MGKTVLVHEEVPTLKTSNLGLRSIAYNNYKAYLEASNAIARNTTYMQSAESYTRQLTIITYNLNSAATILLSCIKSLMNATGRIGEYNAIASRYGY